MRRSFKLQNLECANCASKMESGIGSIPGVSKASISFMAQKLLIDADVDSSEQFESIVDRAEAICREYEKDCTIVR